MIVVFIIFLFAKFLSLRYMKANILPYSSINENQIQELQFLLRNEYLIDKNKFVRLWNKAISFLYV